MDRRLLVALALSVIVIVVIQTVFPSPPPVHGVGADSAVVANVTGPAAEHGGSAAGSASSASGGGALAHPVTQPPASGGVAGSVAGSPAAAPSPGASPAPVLAAPETLTVTTPRTVVSFASIGASPVAVTMRDYHSTVRKGEDTLARPSVRLGRVGESLLRYQVIMGRDTLALDRIAFRGRATQASDGAPVVTYDATVARTSGGSAPVTIQYDYGADGYLAKVSGVVSASGSAGTGAGNGAARTTAPVGGQPAPPAGYLLVELPSGFLSFEADTDDDQQQLAYVVKPIHEDATSVGFSRLDPGQAELRPGPADWAVAKDKYFLVGVLAPDSVRAHQIIEVDILGQPRTGKIATRGAATVVLPLVPTADGGATFAFQLYAGPQEYRRLRAIGHDFENLNPYGGFLHPVLQPFVTLVVQTVIWLRQTLQINYGWVLVIFGVVIRFLLWPVNQRAMRTSLKMQQLQPELAEVQTKYKNDRQRQQEEMVRVYREHGMSPWSPIAGCLPMLLPLPIFGALYFVFRNTIEFRGVPFLWLHDISVRDPYYIMPILMGATSFLVSWVGMRNVPPNPQTKMMGYLFPIMMTVFLAKVAAGLNLYYLVQNLATLPQQWILANERAKSAGAALARGAKVESRESKVVRGTVAPREGSKTESRK